MKVKRGKEVGKAAGAKELVFRETGYPRESAGIVGAPFLGIRQHRVGCGDFLETLLGPRLLVSVRVILQRERAESILDGFLVRVPWDPENLVVIALSFGDGLPPRNESLMMSTSFSLH